MSEELKPGDFVYYKRDATSWGVKIVERRRAYRVQKIVDGWVHCGINDEHGNTIKRAKLANWERVSGEKPSPSEVQE